MSELKVYHCNEWHNEYTEFYLKDEADECISGIKNERDWLAKDRAQAYDDLEKRAQLNIRQEKSIRHQKYKRCLAMAKWCNYWANYLECCEPPDCSLFIAKAKYYRKWLNRWIKIAEQFKED